MLSYLINNLVIEPLQLHAGHPLKCPHLVPAVLNVPPQADLLKVVGSIPHHQVVPPPLGVPVQGEASLTIVVYGEGGAVRPLVHTQPGALLGDAGGVGGEGQVLLSRRPQEVRRCFLIYEHPAITSAWNKILHSMISP